VTNPRKIVAAVLTVVGMLAIYAAGVQVRTARFGDFWMDLSQPFWMESAQRFRYVELVAHGEAIPNPDTRMWAPEGYDPRSDTILQEQLYGSVYRALRFERDVPVEAFVRLFTRIVYCTGIFALVALCGVLTASRPAALLACLAYALILPAVERSTGQVLYREHLAIPILVFHLYFLVATLHRRPWWNAIAAGLILLLVMLTWKVMTFYFLFLVGFFALWYLVEGSSRTLVRSLAACAIPTIGASWLLPVHLHFDRFHFSFAAVLALALLVMSGVELRRPFPKPVRIAGVGLLAAGFTLLFPEARSYDHAWETIRARVSHLGSKPANPAELSFHARHFWSGNYCSPSFSRLLRDFSIPALVAVPGLVATLRHVWRHRRWDGHAVMLFLTVVLGSAYLVFRKLQAFPAMFLSVEIGVGWTLLTGRWRHALRIGLVLGVAWMGLQTLNRAPGPHQLLPREPAGTSMSVVHTGNDLFALTSWIRSNTGPDDILVADFALSPYLLTETDRPIALNCFFESPMVERYKEYTEALFADETTFNEFCRGVQGAWVIHGAHQALRTDSEMSYRYTAAAMDWDARWPAALMQYNPAGLRHFELAWQSPFFRVYRVLGPGEEPTAPPPDREVLFSRALAAELHGDPMSNPWPRQGEPADLLGAEVSSMTDISMAQRAIDLGDRELAVQLLTSAAVRSPYEPAAYSAMSVAADDPEEAAHYEALAVGLRRALAGEIPLPRVLDR